MKPIKSAPKYASPKRIVKGGFRRVKKSELQALGYSPKSVLYTKAGVSKPTRFLTRADIKKVQQPARDAEIFRNYPFPQVKKERIKAARRKIIRHTHTIYSDYQKPITLTQAIELTEKFFEFLTKKYNPKWRNQIGVIYIGNDDEFSLQPRLWRDRKELILDRLKQMMKRYKAKMQIVFMVGWIEQSS